MIPAFWQHRSLLWQLARRDLAAKYRGSALGVLWSLLTPLLMLGVYTLVFSVIFQARWPASTAHVALVLYSGLMVHALAAEVLLRAPTAITAQVNFVKKVVFPLEILPLVPLLTGLVQALISLGVVLLGWGVLEGDLPPLTALWLPIVWLPYLLALSGAAWLLAALGVFLRDIGQMMGLVVSLLLFLSPIFYPPEALPTSWQPILSLNPLTVIVTQTRAVLLWGQSPDFTALAAYSLAASVLALMGYVFFQKTRKGFADVI